jgi:hypothetical protein
MGIPDIFINGAFDVLIIIIGLVFGYRKMMAEIAKMKAETASEREEAMKLKAEAEAIKAESLARIEKIRQETNLEWFQALQKENQSLQGQVTELRQMGEKRDIEIISMKEANEREMESLRAEVKTLCEKLFVAGRTIRAANKEIKARGGTPVKWPFDDPEKPIP